MRQRKYTDLEVDFWPSFADVLLSAILVRIFVVSLLFVSQAGLSRELTVKEKAMQDLSKQLVALEKSLQLSSDKSAMLQGELDATFGLLDKSRTETQRHARAARWIAHRPRGHPGQPARCHNAFELSRNAESGELRTDTKNSRTPSANISSRCSS